MADYSRLVYSSDGGRVQPPPERRRPAAPNRGPSAPSVPNDGIVRVFRDRSGRKGKTVTLVTGVPPNKVDEVASTLKRAAAAGGAIREGAIEIQGDHREMVAARLSDLGFRVKLAGG
jgi:translation initiation factor 1